MGRFQITQPTYSTARSQTGLPRRLRRSCLEGGPTVRFPWWCGGWGGGVGVEAEHVLASVEAEDLPGRPGGRSNLSRAIRRSDQVMSMVVEKVSLFFFFRFRTVSQTGSLTWGITGRGGGLPLILCSDQGARDHDEGREGESAA